MRHVVLALALIWAGFAPSQTMPAPTMPVQTMPAQTMPAQTPQTGMGREPAIEQVITDQIRAFEADDFATAFTYASPMIKGIFGTPEIFGQMVRQGYPMVWRPSAFRFLDITDEGGTLHQKVLVTDAEGVIHVLDYKMTRTPDGWRIDGVSILRAPDTNV